MSQETASLRERTRVFLGDIYQLPYPLMSHLFLGGNHTFSVGLSHDVCRDRGRHRWVKHLGHCLGVVIIN